MSLFGCVVGIRLHKAIAQGKGVGVDGVARRLGNCGQVLMALCLRLVGAVLRCGAGRVVQVLTAEWHGMIDSNSVLAELWRGCPATSVAL